MKKRVRIFLALSLLFASFPAHTETSDAPVRRKARRGDAAGYSCRDATVLSMMGWGIGLAVGIALLCSLLSQDTDADHSHGHSH